MSSKDLEIKRNKCNCHPETCSCDDWNLVYNGEVLARHIFKWKLEKLLDVVNNHVQCEKDERKTTMSKIVIEVSFLAGTDIFQAIRESKEKTKEWNVAIIKFNFNGIDIYISSDSDEYEIYEDYKENIKMQG